VVNKAVLFSECFRPIIVTFEIKKLYKTKVYDGGGIASHSLEKEMPHGWLLRELTQSFSFIPFHWNFQMEKMCIAFKH